MWREGRGRRRDMREGRGRCDMRGGGGRCGVRGGVSIRLSTSRLAGDLDPYS
jgi:hypothetical protein